MLCCPGHLQTDCSSIVVVPYDQQIPLSRGFFIINKSVSSTGGESLRNTDSTYLTQKECKVSHQSVSKLLCWASRQKPVKRMQQTPTIVAASESWNGGKPYCGSVLNLELPAAIGCVRYCAGWADKLHCQPIQTHSKGFAHVVKQHIGLGRLFLGTTLS